jgi:hypothetical protein
LIEQKGETRVIVGSEIPRSDDYRMTLPTHMFCQLAFIDPPAGNVNDVIERILLAQLALNNSAKILVQVLYGTW